MNSVLSRRKESRKRNLTIHLPAAVPLTPSLRLVVNDSSYLTLQDIFDDHCKRHNMLRDVPMLHFIDQFRKIYYPTQDPKADQETTEYKVARMELVEEIAEKFVPETVLTNYMIRTLSDASSLWLMRKHFALQTAANMFLSHVACLSNRTPGRFHLSLKTGLMYMSEVLPSFDAAAPIHRCNEKVPFRLSPNMQHFITPTGIEGILTSSVIAMARSLSMPEFDLESCLTLFLRDEVSLWFTMHNRQSDHPLSVYANVEGWVRRTAELGFTGDGMEKNDLTPITAVVTTLIAQATNTQLLAQQPEQFMPYF